MDAADQDKDETQVLEGEGPGLQDHWYLVDTHGQKFRLPKTMLFLGREECDVVVASQSVDKRHAVLTFDLYLNRFKVKDLSTTNGTFVNNSRIPEQEYVTLQHMDSIRLGHDAMMYHIEQGSQVTQQGGQLPDPHDVPSWASQRHHQSPHSHTAPVQQHGDSSGPTTIHVHAHNMAECQGCIAEQNIEHSCGLKVNQPPDEDDVRIYDPSHQMYHQQHHHHHSQQQQPQSPKGTRVSSPHISPRSPRLQQQAHQVYDFHEQYDHPHHHQHHSPHHTPHHTPPPLPQTAPPVAAHTSDAQGSYPAASPQPHHPYHHHHHDHHHHSHYQQHHHHAEKDQAHGDSNIPSKLSHMKDSPKSERSVTEKHSIETTSKPEKEHATTPTTPDYSKDFSRKGQDHSDDLPVMGQGQGGNTWPRKRVRQTAHVSTLFDQQEGGENGTAATSGSPTSKSGSEAHPAGSIGGMYFVAFDDSICNGATTGAATDGGDAHSLQKSAAVRRNSRGKVSAHELATVKKGTPLYGQPSWWGEDEQGDDDDDKQEKKEGDKKKKSSSGRKPRPSSLSLSSEGSPPTETPPARPVTMEGVPQSDTTAQSAAPHPRQASAYMEIPLHDDDEETKGEVTPDSADHSRDTLTPAQSTPTKVVSPGAEKNPATSFTIDFEEHAQRKININASLSEFVPSKIRRNFRDRKDKAATSRTGSKESTPSKTSEERELSPHQQKKIDDLWSSVENKGKQSSRLSSVHATLGSSSLRSPNLEDIDKLSELSEERKSTERETDKKATGKRPVPATKSPLLPRSTKGRPTSSSTTATSSPQAKRAAAAAAVNVAQYADPTSYLIDKMFEGGTATSSVGSKKTVIPSPEHVLYKESVGHDKSGVTRSGDKSSKVTPKSPGGKVTVSHAKTSLSAKLNRDAKLKKSLQVSPCKLVPDDDDEDEDNNDDNADDDLQITENLTPREDKNKDDKEDKASEAGTYTIEADEKEGQEEEAARKRIDEVFGLDVDTFVDRPVIDALRLDSPGGYDNVYNDEGDKTPLDDGNHRHFPPVGGTGDDEDDDDDKDVIDDINDDLTLNDDDDDVKANEDEGSDYEEGGAMTGTEGGVQTWVSQLTALTSQKMAKDEDGSSLSKKPPQGLSRKRPGTGRKLPSIPTDRSPVSSEHSSYIGGDFGDDGTSSPAIRGDPLVNGKNAGVAATNGKQVRISSQSASAAQKGGSGKTNGHVGRDDDTNVSSPHLSTRSRGSVDTELLLQDTETVMAAMEARITHKSGHPDRRSSYGGNDSDTDVSSTVALANGDDDYVKPTLYKSPRDALKKHQQTTSSKTAVKNGTSSATHATTSSTSAAGKKPAGRTYSQTVSSKARSVQSPRSVTSAGSTRRTVVSDVFSRGDSFDSESVFSDVGSDVGAGDTSFSRSGSKGKGTITMTKPNRAFQLRRARADSADEPTTPRSAKSTASSRASYGGSGTSARSSSVHSAVRNRSAADTGRSEATSLGGQIVRKSRQNAGAPEKTKSNSSSNLARSDGGRHSLRLQRASSLTIAQPGSSQPAVGTKRELGSKSPVRPTYSSSGSRGNLSITGTSTGNSSLANRCHSQPGSRSNSPKAAERAAWKRRKEYDPRKAVAEAKAKAKDPVVTTRPKPSASSSYKRRMIRSASFTNPQELALSVQSSFSSSSQDFSSLTGQSDHYTESAFRRAFLPFQTSLRTDRSAHSADEDDSIISHGSAQDTTRSLVTLSTAPPNSVIKSAFTPPLVTPPATKLTSPSSKLTPPQTPPSLSSSLSLHRRTAYQNGDDTSSGIVVNGHSSLDTRQSSVNSPPQASYDTLIVSSVYQLSLKLKTTTDKTLNKLREQDRVSMTPSPIDDFLSESGRSEIPAWKSANQELAGVLRNLRKIERHVQMMNRVLFPEEDTDSEVGSGIRTGQEKQKYFQEIERIRNEIKGFQPIEPHDQEVPSPEMAELSEQF